MYRYTTGFWAKKGDFAAYFATPERADDSVFKTTLMGLLSGPPQIMCTATVGHFSSGEYAAGAPYAQRSQLLIKAKPGKFDELITNFDDEALGLPFTARQKGFMEMSHSKVVVDSVECLAITGFWKEVGDYAAYLATPDRAPDSEWFTKMTALMVGLCNLTHISLTTAPPRLQPSNLL